MYNKIINYILTPIETKNYKLAPIFKKRMLNLLINTKSINCELNQHQFNNWLALK
jgi:hypothetical protein